MRLAGGSAPWDPEERGAPEPNPPPAGAAQPVAVSVASWRHSDNGGVELDVAGGAVEVGVAEGADASVLGYQPVSAAVDCGGDVHHRGVQPDTAQRPIRPGVAEGVDVAGGGGESGRGDV